MNAKTPTRLLVLTIAVVGATACGGAGSDSAPETSLSSTSRPIVQSTVAPPPTALVTPTTTVPPTTVPPTTVPPTTVPPTTVAEAPPTSDPTADTRMFTVDEILSADPAAAEINGVNCVGTPPNIALANFDTGAGYKVFESGADAVLGLDAQLAAIEATADGVVTCPLGDGGGSLYLSGPATITPTDFGSAASYAVAFSETISPVFYDVEFRLCGNVLVSTEAGPTVWTC